MCIRARVLVLSMGLALGHGCLDPAVIQEKTRLFEAGLLEAVRDGQTTRQEVLLQLGAPSAAFEEGRILTYDFVMEAAGEWRRVGSASVSSWSYAWPRISSLVLVFGPDGRVIRHSLVKDLHASGASPGQVATPPKGQGP